LENDDSANIRVQAIDALATTNAKDPVLVEAIPKISKSDDDEDVRDKARQFLSSAK
jgi:hypothetical protein